MLRIHLKVEKVEEFLEIISRKLEIGIYGCESKANFDFSSMQIYLGVKTCRELLGKIFIGILAGWLTNALMFEITLKGIFLLSKYIRTILEIRYLEYDSNDHRRFRESIFPFSFKF